MDFDDTSAEAEYRSGVRSFLEAHHADLTHGQSDSGQAADHPRTLELRRTQALLYEGGLIGVTWPTEFGGQGLTPMHQAIVDQELARASIPVLINHIGLGMCGPTIVVHGTDEQRARYLAPLLRADEVWCQLFSEPGAGSDLAGIRTSAKSDGDEWRIQGQKVWTTGAQFSRFGLALTRTDPSVPKHHGLTMFVIDMEAPGVTVRPLRQMTGDARFNEVYLDDVVVAETARIGGVGDGWRVALTTLSHERSAIGADGKELGMGVAALIELARRRLPEYSETEQALRRQELGRAVVLSLASRYGGYRRLSALSRGQSPGPEASAGKLAATRAANLVADIGVRLFGPDAVLADGDSGSEAWHRTEAGLPGYAIAGGTDEILKNVIGERVLGLPAEPRVDKDRPFQTAREAVS
jgi:alkylation response protein AidB-like acyl-CoA dehydrogenase